MMSERGVYQIGFVVRVKVVAIGLLAVGLVVDVFFLNHLGSKISLSWKLLVFPTLLAICLGVLFERIAFRYVLSVAVISALILVQRQFFFADDTMFWPIATLVGSVSLLVSFAALLCYQFIARLPK